MKRYTRWFYSLVPGLNDAKLTLERRVRRAARHPTEQDHRAFRFFADKTDALFVDVGANIGQTIDAVRIARWDANILAIEPNPVLAETLRRVYRRDERLTIVNKALADEPGFLTLHVPRYRHYGMSSLASLDRDEIEHFLNSEWIAFFDERHVRVDEVQCDVCTLDSLDCEPFFVKLDVEGFEQQVVKGALKTIAKCLPVFLIEMPGDRFDDGLLRDFGYAPFAFDGVTFQEGQTGRHNTFFFTPDKLPN